MKNDVGIGGGERKQKEDKKKREGRRIREIGDDDK